MTITTMSDFYVVLPSNSNPNEYPNNTSSSVKVRLPTPIRLEGDKWRVALVSIAIPESKVDLAPIFGNRPLFQEVVRVNGHPPTLMFGASHSTKMTSPATNGPLVSALCRI